MTLVNTETGEVVELDRAVAERRAERIRLRLDTIADNLTAVLPMIREAIAQRDDIALGYRSPGEYVADRFGQALSGLAVELRRAVVGELTAAGMSTRAIAPVVGVSQRTVVNDSQVSNVAHLAPTPAAPAAGAAPAQPESPKVAPDEETDTAAAAVVTEDSTATTPEGGTPATPRPPVVGIDGKTYRRPASKPKPVLDGDAAEYANAEQAVKSLTRAIAKLLEFEHPNMRAGMRRYWAMASSEVPPAQRADVTPEQMRAAAHGLLALADEWNRE